MNFDDIQKFVTRGHVTQEQVNKLIGEYMDGEMADDANFRVVFQTKAFVLIEDLGPYDKFLTITNAAEKVVRYLVSNGKLQAGQRLFYLDSEKNMEEIEFDVLDGFQRFNFIDTMKDETAGQCFKAWKATHKDG